MDIVSHGLIGAALSVHPRYKKKEILVISLFGLLPDLFQIPVYLFLGFIKNRPFWFPQNTDWIGFRDAYPVWSALWEIPHSLFFLVILIIPLVYYFKLPKIAIVSYFSHIFTDIFTHTGEWAVKPLFPIDFKIDGFTDAWAWDWRWYSISWVVLLAFILMARKKFYQETSNTKKKNLLHSLRLNILKIIFPEFEASLKNLNPKRLSSLSPDFEEDPSMKLNMDYPSLSQTDSNKIVHKDIIEIYKIWYDTYYNIIKFIAMIGIGVLGFTVSSILLKSVENPDKTFLKSDDIVSLKYSIYVIIASIVSSFACILSTYGWFVTLLERARNSVIQNSGIKISELQDINYRKKMGSMKFWGIISLITGWLSGILLAVGIIMYSLRLFEILIKK